MIKLQPPPDGRATSPVARSGIQGTKNPREIRALAETTQFVRQVSPGIWRRYLSLVLDGLRPERQGVTPLPVPALAPGEMDEAMRQYASRHL